MSYIQDMDKCTLRQPAARFGDALRRARHKAGLTQRQLAERAQMPRQKLIQLEQGRPGVAIAAYAAALDALGLELELKPRRIRIADFPQLHRLAWNRPGDEFIEEDDALALYERNWRLVELQQMSAEEKTLLDGLIKRHGGGVLHV
jgi:transcriptional regulator with XRE-family HTH domain